MGNLFHMDAEFDNQTSLRTIFDYGKSLLKWSWLLILVAALAAAVVYYYSNREPRVYQASTRLVFNTSSGSSDMINSSQARALTVTYAKTMITKDLLQKVANELKYPVTASVSTTADPESPIIIISVQDNDAQKAAQTANAVARVIKQQVESDQSSSYIQLESSIEDQVSRIDAELNKINERLAQLQDTNQLGGGVDDREPVDTETYVLRSQLEMSLSQLTQTRYSLVYNLQQVRLTKIKSSIVVNQLDPAVPNPKPIKPQPLNAALLGGLVGLFVSGGSVFLGTYLKDEIRDPGEINQLWGLPVLGSIPRSKLNGESLVSLSQPRSPVVEAYRLLRTNLQFSNVDSPVRTMLFTSPSEGDGKTTTASNLSVVMAHDNSKVILIDCDMRKPNVHNLFGMQNRLGLSNLFVQTQHAPKDVVHKTEVDGLYLVTGGSVPPNPTELLNSNKMKQLVESMKAEVDIVLLDCPPLLVVADALVLSPRVDGVVLVVNPHRTKRAMINDAVNQLRQVNANILGVVLNGVDFPRSYYYYKSRYYGKNKEQSSLLPRLKLRPLKWK